MKKEDFELGVLRPEDADEATLLFVENVDKSYISHGEMQIGRAISESEWAENLYDQVRAEIIEIVSQDTVALPCCRNKEGKLVGWAICSLNLEYRYAELEDLVVKCDSRKNGIGKLLIESCEKFVKDNYINQIFLESGILNYSAHSFFSKFEYKKCSHVFRKILD
ncbi:GNAT family N-acetyltransferase [Gimesia maris]|uniref:GNAT family N-acetyltransferase n=1 Tax=Gimesia maris TaxID=122 RepID=UPI0018D60DCB|nr:GNAT family N-acetyltransferase [Gimesia maris]